jgi:hypothetical protein
LPAQSPPSLSSVQIAKSVRRACLNGKNIVLLIRLEKATQKQAVRRGLFHQQNISLQTYNSIKNTVITLLLLTLCSVGPTREEFEKPA